MPDLFIIAGPNGAGKSTYSALLTLPELSAFDGDKELLKLQQKYRDIDTAQLLEVVNGNLFIEAKEQALKNQKDFAFETNFASKDVMHTAAFFKEKGYSINLIFIGLSSSDRAIERVASRVKKGGHNVDNEQIRYNYKKGIKNLEIFFDHFDRVMIYDNTSNRKMSPPKLLYKLEKGQIIEKATTIPAWAEFHIGNRLETLENLSKHKTPNFKR